MTAKYYLLLGTLFIISRVTLAGQLDKKDSNHPSKTMQSYSFIFRDSPATLSTMRQFNENYLSANRFFTSKLRNSSSHELSFLIRYFSEIFLLPLTHEEGHRSILTSMGIGSVSQPYFNTNLAAYVKGVRDVDLINLRDHHLPTYVRLHTAGLESDYMLCNKMEELVMFGYDSRENVYMGFLFRKCSLISYYSMSFFPSLNVKFKEEANELDRDIVGHDIYGAIKNLYRPQNPFYRYTNLEDLTHEEKRFAKRLGYRSFLNLVNPLFIKYLNIIERNNFKLSADLGYTMCPFGDFIDENIWVKMHKKYNIHMYFRQFQNRNNWFTGGGVNLVNYNLSQKITTSIKGHIWSQPLNMDFNTPESRIGGAGDILLKYMVMGKRTSNYLLSMDLGLIYKTEGFLPEEVILDKHLGLRLGTTINLNR